MVNLHPYEMAYLMRGADGTLEASVVALVAASYMTVSRAGLQSMDFGGQSIAHFHPLDQSLLLQCRTLLEPSKIAFEVDDALKEIRWSLERKGFLLATGVSTRSRLIVFLCGIAVESLGVVKFFIGQSRGRPVGILVLLIVLGGVLLHFLARPWPPLTDKGEQARLDLLANHAALRHPSRPLSVKEFAMAAGIFGLEALGRSLAGGVLPLLFLDSAQARKRANASAVYDGSCGGGSCGGGSCGGGSCGGGSCGGGSCGGGSCGGGGCGGCGS